MDPRGRRNLGNLVLAPGDPGDPVQETGDQPAISPRKEVREVPGQDLAPAPDHRQGPATPTEPEVPGRQSHIIPGEVVTIDQDLRRGTDLGHRSLLVFGEDVSQDLPVDILRERTDQDRRRLLVFREEASDIVNRDYSSFK